MNGQRVFHGCLIILSIVHFSSCQIAGTTSSAEDSPAYASTIVATTTVLVPDTTEATSTTLHLSTAAPVSTTDPSLTSTGSPPSVSTTTPISFEPTSKPTTSPVPDAVPEPVLVDSDGLCPKDFVYFTKSATCYKVYSLPVTWVEADRICRKDKAVLVSAPLVQVPHFANLTTYWLNWRLRPTIQYPTEIKRNESEVRSRMWYRESIYPAKGNFITANEGLHAVHRASELQFARSMLGTALQPDQNVSEHGELGDSCLFATRSHPSSFEPYRSEILSTSQCMNPPNSSFSTIASFVCEFNVEEYAVFTAAQLGRARLMTSWSDSTHYEGLLSVSDGYKKKYKDCYTAFPFPNDTAYFHPAGGLGMSHWVVEGPERTACYMTKYLDLESSKGWSFEGAKESCQQYSSFLQPSTAFPTLYQSRSVGQFVYSRFFDDVVAGVVGTELGRWVGAVWVNGSEANGGNGTWYWDGPDGHGVQVPLRFLLSIIGDDGKCLEERQQLPLELFTPEKISALLSGEGNSFLGWYRRSCSNQSSLGTLQRSSVVCQKDLTRLTTTPPGDSVNLAVTIRKGYDSYSQWANHPDEIPLLTCDIPENETLFDSPVVFLSSWFTYKSSVWRPYLTYHLNLDQVIGNSSGNQFSMDFQNGFRPEAPQNPEKNFCLANEVPVGPGQLVPPCVPSTETQYFGDIGLPSDYMLLRFAGYYQCGAVSSSTNQWVWSDPIYVEDSFLRYPFQIYSSLDITAASLQVAGTQNFHPFDNLWNFVLSAVEDFTVDFHTSNRSHELQQYLRNGSSSIVLTVLQLEETNKLTDKEVTLSGLLAVRKINMSMSGPQPNKRDAERQEPSYSSISPTEMARATQDLTSSERFIVDRLMYSLDRHLVKSAKENNLSGYSVIIKSTSGCWNERHYFVQSNLTFRWLEFKPDVVNRSFDYPVEYCPGTPYRRDCTGNREHGFTSKFVEGKCTGPIFPPSPLTTSLLDLQANSPPGPEQLSTLNKTVSNETNFSIVDLRLIGQILQSNTDPKLSSIPQSSFDNIYDVINRILQLDRPNNVGTAQSVYGSSNQFLSSMGSAAALVDTADHRPVERKMLSVSVFSVSSHNDTIGFTADSTGLTKTENRTHAHPDTVNVSMAFPTSLAEHLLNKSARQDRGKPVRGHFLVIRSTDFLNTQNISLNGHPVSPPSVSQYQLASWVVAASFSNTAPIINWQDNITITTRVEEAWRNSSKYVCVFWNPLANSSYGEWQTDGCHFVKYHQGHVVCQCNHLTAFSLALMIDAHGNQPLPANLQYAIHMITFITLPLSIIGLICTILLLIYAKLYINTHPRVFTKNQFVIFNLCIALLLLYTTMLSRINQKNDVKAPVPCVAQGAFIHYFFLVSFGWQAVEAYLLQTTFLNTLSNVHMHRFRSKTLLFCWGIPLAIVSIVLIVDYHSYFSVTTCWLDTRSGGGAFYGGFLTPVCLVLLYSLIVFVLVIRAVSCTKKDYVRSTRSEEDLNTQLRRCISLFFILGFSWLFLILNAVGRTTEGKMAMYVLVGVFCGLQGVAILVVTVLGMRKELFNRRKMRLAPTSGPSRPATASVHKVSSSSTIETESDLYRVGSEIAIIGPTSEEHFSTTVRYRRAGSFVSGVDSGLPPQ